MKYSTIYTDPPWAYDDARTHASAGMARSAYECMSVEDLCALPVQAVTAKNTMLCLWCTWPKLREGLQVIEAWGFEYICCGWVWLKLNPRSTGIYSGLGHWTNGNTEFCLLGRKGHPKRLSRKVKQVVLPLEPNEWDWAVPQYMRVANQEVWVLRGLEETEVVEAPEVVVAHRGHHSSKPPEVRSRIEQLLEGPYLEMFATRPLYGAEPAPGWTMIGRDIDGLDVTEALTRLVEE